MAREQRHLLFPVVQAISGAHAPCSLSHSPTRLASAHPAVVLMSAAAAVAAIAAAAARRKRKSSSGARAHGDGKKARAKASAVAVAAAAADGGGDAEKRKTAAAARASAAAPTKVPKSVHDKIVAAIRALASPTGSSSVAISKYLQKTWQYANKSAVKKALKAGIVAGVLVKRSAMSFAVASDPAYADTRPKITVLSEKQPCSPPLASAASAETAAASAASAGGARTGDTVQISYSLFIRTDGGAGSNGGGGGGAADAASATGGGAAWRKVEQASKFAFCVGGGEVIKGMDHAVQGLRLGGSRAVLVPWQLGYGRRGSPPDIPPQTDLRFDLKVRALQKQPE